MFKNRISTYAPILAVALWLGAPEAALAQASSLGDALCILRTNAAPYAFVFQWVAYAAGVVFGLAGIHHFRLHTDDPRNNPMNRAVMLWVGAAMLLALPSLISTVIGSIYTTQTAAGVTTCVAGPTGGGGTAGLDVMMANFVGNIKGPMLSFISLTAMLCGLFMFVRGLMKAAKYGFDPKTHSINSILASIGFGALLITIGDNMSMMLGSVFGTNTVAPQGTISFNYIGQLAGGASAQFQTAIEAALTFFQIIGTIAFVRGWLLLKKVADGGNASMAQGITHILGGVLAINIYAFLKMMDTTFGTNML